MKFAYKTRKICDKATKPTNFEQTQVESKRKSTSKNHDMANKPTKLKQRNENPTIQLKKHGPPGFKPRQ